MSTEITTTTSYSYEAMARMMGQHVSTTFLPGLKINTKASVTVDGKKKRLDPGVFCVDKDGETVYAIEGQPVYFRPLIQRYQYIRYDAEFVRDDGNKGAVINKSVLKSDCRKATEYPDERATKGGKCGKIKVAEGEKVSAEQEKTNKQTSLYRMLFGLVTFDGKTADGRDVRIENFPCVLKRRGQDFMTFGKEVENTLGKGKTLISEYAYSLTTEERENGSTIYYLVHFDFDRKNKLTMEDPVIIETFNAFMRYIDEENEAVMEKHIAALEDINNGPDKDDVDYIDGDGAEMPDDDIPF